MPLYQRQFLYWIDTEYQSEIGRFLANEGKEEYVQNRGDTLGDPLKLLLLQKFIRVFPFHFMEKSE